MDLMFILQSLGLAFTVVCEERVADYDVASPAAVVLTLTYTAQPS